MFNPFNDNYKELTNKSIPDLLNILISINISRVDAVFSVETTNFYV